MMSFGSRCEWEMSDEFFFWGGEARIKDVKWPATEPEAIHQDVSGFKTSTQSSFRELKKKKETNWA